MGALEGNVYLLYGSTVEDQLREVCAVCGVDGIGRVARAMTQRCCMCNGMLKPAGKKEVSRMPCLEMPYAIGQKQRVVPNRIIKMYDHFLLCSNDACHRALWHGGMYENEVREIRH